MFGNNKNCICLAEEDRFLGAWGAAYSVLRQVVGQKSNKTSFLEMNTKANMIYSSEGEKKMGQHVEPQLCLPGRGTLPPGAWGRHIRSCRQVDL